MKLTPKQNAIIYCLQNGWVLITSSSQRSVVCGSSTHEFEFSGALFWRLVKMGLIRQENKPPFDYILTEEGKNIKTKKVVF